MGKVTKKQVLGGSGGHIQRTTVRFPSDLYSEVYVTANEDERKVNGQIIYLVRLGLKCRSDGVSIMSKDE